jgi:hypothetical protein
VPQTKETQSSADKNTVESTEKKQQVPAVSSSKTNSAAKGSIKVSDVTGLTTTTKTSAISSAAETVRITTENDVTGKNEVREHRYYWVAKKGAQVICLTIALLARHFSLCHNFVVF